MGYSKIVLTGFFALSQYSAMGAEVDQFTQRDETLTDSASLINQKANAAILAAVKNANNKNKGCDEKILYKELKGYYSNHLSGKLIKDILKDKNIDQRNVPIQQSVYQDWNAWDGVGMGIKFISKTGDTMSGVMRVGDQYVGVDKMEHMFGQGFKYFRKNYLEGKGEISAAKSGTFREKFFLGGNKIGNGVFSYGDLSANFNGMRMWNHMLQKNDDILGVDHNVGPYISCVDNKWSQVKDIDFKYYLDDSMDESINCSKFPTDKTANKFANRLKIMGMTCPMDQSKLDDMVIKYRQMSKWIINTKGIDKVKYLGKFTE